jgi:hypothetical protein
MMIEALRRKKLLQAGGQARTYKDKSFNVLFACRPCVNLTRARRALPFPPPLTERVEVIIVCLSREDVKE